MSQPLFVLHLIYNVGVAQLSRIKKSQRCILTNRRENSLIEAKTYIVNGFLMRNKLCGYLLLLDIPYSD